MNTKLERINVWFKKLGENILKNRWLIIGLFIIVNIYAISGLPKIIIDSSNESWFLDDDPIQKATEQFEQVFGNNQYVAFLVEADDVFSPEVLTMMRELGDELMEKVPFAEEVISLANVEITYGEEFDIITERLIPDEIPTSRTEIEAIRKMVFSKKALVNRLISDDSKETWVTLKLKNYPENWEKEHKSAPEHAVGEACLKIINQEKYQKYNIKGAGLPVVTYEKMVYFANESTKVVSLVLVVAIILLVLILRSVRGVVIPLLTTISSIIIVFGMMGHLGVLVSNVVMTVPIYLAMAVSIGYSVHIFNFFSRGYLTTGKRIQAILYAVEHTGWPLLFTALTTIISLLSFYFISISTVRWVGLTSAATIFTVYLMVMLLTPALLSFGKGQEVKKVKKSEKVEIWSDKYFVGFHNKIMKNAHWIVLGFIVVILICSIGVTRIRVSMDYKHTMGLKIPYISRLEHVRQTKVGSLYSYNLSIKFPEVDRVKDPEILKKLDQLEEEARKLSLTKKVNSLLDVIKDMNQVVHGNDLAYYIIPEERELISQLLLLYEMSGGTQASNWVDYNYQTLNFQVDVNKMDSAVIEEELSSITETAKQLFPDAEIGLVGGLVQFMLMHNYISRGEIYSFCIALTVIGILMIMVFGSIKAGLIGMIPNVTPVVIVGGLMGYAGIPLDMMSMTIIPMLLGLAVDDTIHFITHAKLEVEKTGDYTQSISKTFKSVGKSLAMTSIIICSAFGVYMISEAKFFFNLGMLTVIGISSALITDYLITPILLNWGKPFAKEVVELEQTEVSEGLSTTK